MTRWCKKHNAKIQDADCCPECPYYTVLTQGEAEKK